MGIRRETNAVPKLPNSTIADTLESFAGLLDLSGASFYTSRAYRRAAELVRSTEAPIAELVASGRARELRGIGPGIEARLKELVETGKIAELEELESSVSPELVGLGRFLGLGPKRAVEIGQALGVRTAEEFRAAAEAGRLSEAPGIGPKTEQRILERLSRAEQPRPRRGLTLNRALALSDGIASAVGGTTAGHPRRRRDTSERFAVVVAAADPAPALDRFAALPQIVSIVEREERRAIGVDVEGVPVELVAADPAKFGTELVRATGSRAYVAALGELPDESDEDALYAALGSRSARPSSARSRSAASRRRSSRSPTSAATCTSTRPGRTARRACSRWARRRGSSATSTWRSATTRRTSASSRALDADELRRQAEEIAAANEQLAPFRILRGTECDIRADGTLDLPTTCSPSSTGCSSASTPASGRRATS